MIQIDIVTGISLGVGWAGFGLSLLNTWLQIDSNRVKLLVKPTLYVATNRKVSIGVEAINMSAIPITLQQAGIIMQDKNGKKSRFPGYRVGEMISRFEISIEREKNNSEDKLPKRIEPRGSLIVTMDDIRYPEWIPIQCYATTACLKNFYGKGPSLNKFKNIIRSESLTKNDSPL